MALRVVFAGTPEFAVPALQAVADGQQLVGVLTQPDRPAGRGLALTQSPVKQRAVALGCPVAQPATLRVGTPEGLAARQTLRAWAPDVMVVVAYGLILPPDVLALPHHGCLNVHASLLPRWRGAAPIQRAILAGDERSGVTIMQMAEGLDTGDICLAADVPLGATTTAGELHDALAALGAGLIAEALARLASGQGLPHVPQDDRRALYAPKLDKAEARVDWNVPAAVVDRRIRGYSPWPAATTALAGESVRLLRSRLLAETGMVAPPGTVLGLEGEWLAVACGAGVVGVGELQRAGRRRISARDFANAELRPESGRLRFG